MPAEEVGLTLCITVKGGITIGIKNEFPQLCSNIF